MHENPYRTPVPAANLAAEQEAVRSVVGIRSGRFDDLKRVAWLQRYTVIALLFSIPATLAYAILWVADNWFDFFDDNLSRATLSLPMVLQYAIMSVLVFVIVFIGICSLVALFLSFFLAARFYHVLIAMVIGLISLYPGVGLVTLFFLNLKARKVLRANGIPLGRLWAKP